MRRKYFLVTLFLILAIFLTGCSAPGINQEMEVNITVNSYWLALSDKQYELAKTYCVPYGDAYYAVEDYQILSDYDYVTINWTPYINWIEIIGSKATVNMTITLDVTICFEDICSSQSETLYNYSMYLAKISGTWKLK